MRSDPYVHPEFGFLSPTPRLRRELRMAFFSVLFGIAIGAAAVIALSGNNNADHAQVSRGVGSASVISEQPTEAVSGYNSPQAAEIEKEVTKGYTGKPDGSVADADSKDREISATTTCEDKNSSCLRGPAPAGKPRGMRMPAANDALPIARAPLGRADASAGMTSAAPLVSSERVPERATAGRPQQHNADKTAVDSDEAHSNRLSHKTPHKSAHSQNRPRQEAPSYGEDRAANRIGRGYDGPVGELGRAFAHERLYGQKGFWEWSR